MATQTAAGDQEPHVRVWCADVEARSATELAVDLELLDSREREQAQRFYFEADRRAYITAHALVRRALSDAAAAGDDSGRTIDPRDWHYRTGSHGRPDVAGPPHAPPLRFNLSHCRGMVTCAVTSVLDIGIDIEDTRRNAPLEIADHYFAPTEVAALRSLPAAEQPGRFFVYWTLKESYIKARGLGLSLPLAEFAFSVAGANKDSPRVTLSAALLREDSPERWWFASWKVRNRFQLALAVASMGRPARISHSLF